MLFGTILKWIFDRVAAVTALVILSPFILGVAILVRVKIGSPIFFTQARPGKNGRIFNFYKFRTMTDAKDKEGQLLPDEDRLLPFGEWLRSSSLDELPQLLNVAKGDMSFIGPRPLMVRYLKLYSPQQARRHEVLPGITGLAQINGRNNISWEDKFEFDVKYIDNWSLWLDFKILLLTVWKVIKKDGISKEGFATAEEFKGNYK